MEEFDNNTKDGANNIDQNLEEELVEQLEDFESMPDNNSDNDLDHDESQDQVFDIEKENDHPKKSSIMKNPSSRQIHTSDGERSKDFGIIGKGFNDKPEPKTKIKEQFSPRVEKKDEKKDEKKKIVKNNEKRIIRDLQIDSNVMITGNQLRPGEVVANEKGKKDKNQKSIIGWFYKNKK